MTFQKCVRFLDGAFVLFFFAFIDFSRGKAGAAKAAVVRRFADENEIVTVRVFRSARVDDFIIANRAQSDDIHETAIIVPGIIVHIAGNRWHADWIPIARDTADNALVNPFCFCRPDIAKTQGIGIGDDFGPHARDIAHIAADTGGRTFVWDDLRWAVV